MIVVVADTSWGLTCHTRSAAHPCSPRSSYCAPHPSLSSRIRPTLPLPSTGTPFSPFPSLSFSFYPPASSIPRRYTSTASGDTRGPTQVMHGPPYIFDPLFGLFFPTGSNVRCLSCPRRAFTSPITLRTLALSPRAVARWKDHDCRRLSFALSVPSSPHLLPHLGRVQHAVLSNKHPRCTSVTPVIVRLLTGMYANDMLGASRRDGPCARVYSDATRDPGSCRKPPPPDGHVEIGSFRNIEAHMMPRRHARAQASFMPLVNRELGGNGEVKLELCSTSISSS